MEEYQHLSDLVLERTYIVSYTDGEGQPQKDRGKLISLNHEGFVVLEVNGKNLLVLKERIYSLAEVE